MISFMGLPFVRSFVMVISSLIFPVTTVYVSVSFILWLFISIVESIYAAFQKCNIFFADFIFFCYTVFVIFYEGFFKKEGACL